MAIRKTPEGYVLAACRDYLEHKGWFVMRMNSGAVQDKRGIPVRMHEPGTADLLAIKQAEDCDYPASHQRVVWVECKAAGGKQSDKQAIFADRVRAEGHTYLLAYGIDDLVAHEL